MPGTLEKAFMQNGFMINKLSKEELKTLLGVYYEQNVTTTKFEDKDGERWFKKKNFDVEKYNTQTFLDTVTPSIARFYIDHFILGNTYRSVWAIRQYPTQTEEQALLRHLGDKENVTLKIYSRVVTPLEERKIIQNATNKNKMKVVSATQLQDSIESKEDLLDLNTLIADMHRSKEPLVHTAVFIEMMAPNLEDLKLIEVNVFAELSRSKINVDKLLLRQKEGLLAVSPSGYNLFKEEFERVMPAKSVANLFPFNYSGKTDDKGFSLGQDVNGTNIIVDFDKRTEDKTNSNIIILGNSGQGKSYLLKLININLVESGKNVIILDPESEYDTLTYELGGDYM